MKPKMAKKPKRKKARKPSSYMMVIRVAVPARDVPAMKVCRVYGRASHGYCELQVLNAYYDKAGHPDAMPAAA